MIELQEELIEKVINIEQQAQRLKDDLTVEIKELEGKYEKRMAREEKVKIEESKKEGEEILAESKAGAERFAANLEEESKNELKKIENNYQKVKADLLKKYFDKIISSGR